MHALFLWHPGIFRSSTFCRRRTATSACSHCTGCACARAGQTTKPVRHNGCLLNQQYVCIIMYIGVLLSCVRRVLVCWVAEAVGSVLREHLVKLHPLELTVWVHTGHRTTRQATGNQNREKRDGDRADATHLCRLTSLDHLGPLGTSFTPRCVNHPASRNLLAASSLSSLVTGGRTGSCTQVPVSLASVARQQRAHPRAVSGLAERHHCPQGFDLGFATGRQMRPSDEVGVSPWAPLVRHLW